MILIRESLCVAAARASSRDTVDFGQKNMFCVYKTVTGEKMVRAVA